MNSRQINRVAILLMAMIITVIMPYSVQATTSTLTAKTDFETGTFTNTEAASKEGEIKLKSAGSWGARSWKTPKIPLTNQTGVVSDGNYVYILAGFDRYFARYLPNEDRWQELASAPHGAYNGTSLTIMGNYIYAIYGGYQNEFSRYSIINNSWEDLADLPDLILDGASIVSDGTYSYATKGGWTQDFWRYDPSTNTWLTTLSYPPGALQQGSDMVYQDGSLYVPRGYYQDFYKYNIASNTWSSLTSVPADFYPMYGNHNIDINGDYIYFMRDYASTTGFYRYQISTNTWESLVTLPQATAYVGNVYNAADGYLYVFRGSGLYDFWKYDIANNEFLGEIDLPIAPGSGADLVYDNGYVYYHRGHNANGFYRYSTSSKTWETLTSSTVNFNNDTKAELANGTIYFYLGNSTAAFYSYNIAGNSWAQLADAPSNAYYGGALVYPGSGDFLYGTRGSMTTSFWRYSISGNSWSDVAVADLPDNAEAGFGSRLISDGTDLYYTSGYGTSEILKYSITGNTWTKLNNLPFAPYWGTDISYYNGKIYAQAGYYKGDLWEYSIANNSWRYLLPMATYGPTEIGPWNGGSLVNDGSGNFYSIYGMDVLRMQTFSVSANNYQTSGTWTSAVLDLTHVDSWTSLTTSMATPGDADLVFQTRSSSDQITWTDWETVSGGAISSTPNQYLQIKAAFTSSSDNSQTPVLYSVTVDYTGDANPPSNPSSLTALSSQVGGSTLISGNSYGHAHPYFTWSGALDAETEVSGYYVYFGSSNTADPETEGSYQISTNYMVTTPMANGTYYLIIQTKDSLGNVSAAETLFTYVYQGVSPPQTLTQTLTEDFSQGTLDNVSTSSDQIKLSSKSSFWENERLMYSPAGVYLGSEFAYIASSNKLYLLRGYNTTTFYEYDLTTDVWTTKAVTPSAAYYGSDLAEGPAGYLYALKGLNTSGFWRYDIANDTWSDAAATDFPQSTSYGATLISTGDRYIYALRGNGDDAFYRYDTLTDLWEQKANIDFGATSVQINNLVQAGADLAYDGADTIYAIQGNSRTGFSAYSITSDQWLVLPNAPFIESSGARIEYDSTTNAVYYFPGNNKTFFYKYSIDNQTWSELTEVPGPISYGSTMKNVNGELYVMRGGGAQTLYKYNIAKASWQTPQVGLFGGWYRGSDSRTFNYGADIIKGNGNYFYFTRGNFDNTFFRYNETTAEVVQMADAPSSFYYGTELVYDSVNNQIYATSNYYDRKFYKYDIATDIWSEITTDPPPYDPYVGSAMVFDGAQYIYWLRGNANTFYRYNLQGEAASRWELLTNAPSTMSYGADLVYRNGYIYAIRGGTGLTFYRYDPAANTWNDAVVADLPTGYGIYNDGFLVDGGGDYLYACRGWNQKDCLRYSLTNNTWEVISDVYAPYISAGGAAASNGVDKIYVIPGSGGNNTFTNGLYTLVMQTNNSSFEENGSYISLVHDLTSVYRFADLALTYTSGTNTTLTVSSRSSADNETWSSWVTSTEEKQVANNYTYKINSAVNRYLQLKFELASGDGIYSGVISDYTVNYYQDVTLPSNPSDTGFNAYTTATQAATLTTETWANSSAPYFNWAAAEAAYGASDGEGGSGIAGYYVYLGTDSEANASESGTLVIDPEYTASNLASGETYYLRIQAIDDSDNFAPTNWQPFIYKYDNVVPENPTTIVVTPSGYTNVNDYTFSWSGASDSASLIRRYWYKTGPAGTEMSTVEATASGVVKYTTGTNTLYLQAEDYAGNRASSWVTASYYYSGTAAGAPTNLRITYPVSGSSNTVNEFAFAWDPPSIYYGQQASLRYHYWINRLPSADTAENALGLAVTYLSKGAYAQDPGQNTLYVVAEDEAGNLDYNNYSSITFTSSTSSPGVPRNLDISDVSIKETSAWRLALSWDQPESSGSGIAEYRIYRSSVEDAECNSEAASDTDFTYIASTSQTSYVDTGLTQETKYYCVNACNYTGGKGCGISSDTVSLYPDGRWRVAPALTASPSATIKTKSAIIVWSTNRTSNSFVQYGKSSGTYGEETGSSTQVTSHSVELTGLDPGATYYFKALWTDEDGNSGSSDEISFTTNPAPTVSQVTTSNVSIYGANVTFTIANAIKATVEYGLDLNYGGSQSISIAKNESTHTVILSDLTEGSAYNFRIKAEDDEANVYYSDNYTFETLPVPKILALKVQQVVGMPKATLRLLWTTNTDVSSIITYYPSLYPESAKDYINLTLKKTHEVIIQDLQDETDYTLLVSGKDLVGNEAGYPDQKVKTATDFRPPLIENFNLETTVVGVGDEARAKLVITWDTDEPSTTQVEYAQGTSGTYSQTTQEDKALTSNHVVTITGLRPSTIYHLRAISKDKAKNATRSEDTVVITPKSTKGALELVVDNLSKSFGFLKGVKVK